MPKANFVRKSRKDNPAVKKGESYWWWKPNFGRKRYFKTKPSRSQMTNSSFLSSIWAIEDNLSICDVTGAEELVSELQQLCDECQDSLDNMPEHLQDSSSSGQRLTERIDGLTDWISEIESIDWNETSIEDASQQIADSNPGTW